MSDHRSVVLVWLSALVSLAAVPVMAATMPAVTMNVVDERDGKPIPGVVALFWGTGRDTRFLHFLIDEELRRNLANGPIPHVSKGASNDDRHDKRRPPAS